MAFQTNGEVCTRMAGDMSPTAADVANEPTLWRLVAFGQERHPPGRPYWFDNAGREPAGVVVAQVSLAGRMVFRQAGREHVVGPGQMVLFAMGEDSSYGRLSPTEPAYECRWLNLIGAGVAAHLHVFRAMHGSVLSLDRSGALLGDMDELIAIAGPRGEASATEAAAAAYRFFMRLFEHARQQHRAALSPVQRAVEYVMGYPTRVRSLKELADRFGCSREHLSRVFRDRTGLPPAAYLGAARLRQALRLITQTSLPLAAIAEQSGFGSRHTMARQLRQATGCAVGDLRDNPMLAERMLRQQINSDQTLEARGR